MRKGQVYSEFLLALFALAGVTMLYIVLQQVYENTLYDLAVSRGTDSTVLGYIETAWDIFTIPLLISMALGVALSGRIRRVPVAEV